MQLVTNFVDFPARWQTGTGLAGTSTFAQTANEFLRAGKNGDSIFLVNCSPSLTWELARKQLVSRRTPVVSVDLVIRRPKSLAARLSLPLKRFLFGRTDYFIHYFRDVRGLDEVYGIDAGRSGFVPFKANIWQLRAADAEPGGEYVLCFGRSVRDFDTFFAAMETLPYPGAIVDPVAAAVLEHGSRFTRPLSSLPANIRVLEHDLTAHSQAEVLANARIVVIPILKGAIVSAGISTALNAMVMGKCVIATEGPGVTDIFDGQLISVPAEDPAALAKRIAEVWEDDGLRTRTARAGYDYAISCGTTQDFYQRVIEQIGVWRNG